MLKWPYLLSDDGASVTSFGEKFATWAKFEKSGHFLSNYFVFGTIVNLLRQIFYTIGQTFIVLNGQILNKWSSHLVTLDGAYFTCNQFYFDCFASTGAASGWAIARSGLTAQTGSNGVRSPQPPTSARPSRPRNWRGTSRTTRTPITKVSATHFDSQNIS